MSCLVEDPFSPSWLGCSHLNLSAGVPFLSKKQLECFCAPEDPASRASLVISWLRKGGPASQF